MDTPAVVPPHNPGSESAATTFERHVRTVFETLGTPCPLDGTGENLLQWFNCGRWALVQRDIRAVLPDHIAAAAIGVCERHGVWRARPGVGPGAGGPGAERRVAEGQSIS